MRRVLVVASVVLSLSSAAFADDIKGTWSAESESSGWIQLNLSRKHSHNDDKYPLTAFEALSEVQVNAATQTAVQFRLRREAGTLNFEGLFKEREGAGHFTFLPNRQFSATLRALGVEPSRKKHMSDEDDMLYHFAVQDVSSEFIKGMQAEGYRVSADDYLEMRIFDISPALVREFRSLGYDGISSDDLVASQIHKATPDFIRQLRALGYTNIPMDDLVAFRIHKVTPEFIGELRALGYQNVAADDLVAMRIHRVTPEFIREMREAGYTNVPVEKLIEMKIHGLDATFVKKMNSKK
jgi:hypothetical protein